MTIRIIEFDPHTASDELWVLADNSLIDAYHQAWEDHRDARAEGSDNLDKAGADVTGRKTSE